MIAFSGLLELTLDVIRQQYRMKHIVLNHAVVPNKELHHSNKNTVLAYTVHDDIYTGKVPVLYIYYMV